MSNRKSYDKSTIEKLDAADWSSMMPVLIKYAQAMEKLLIAVYSDLTYLDIIREAIARVYGRGENGKYRNWDSNRYPDLSKFLKYIIKDVIRDEVSRLTGYKTEQLFWENESGEERAFQIASQDNADAHKYSTPENLIIERETSIKEDALAKKFWESIQEIELDDEDLGLMLLSIKDGKTKSAQIAADIGFDINKVYNLKKRLKRRLKWYREKYEINTT